MLYVATSAFMGQFVYATTNDNTRYGAAINNQYEIEIEIEIESILRGTSPWRRIPFTKTGEVVT